MNTDREKTKMGSNSPMLFGEFLMQLKTSIPTTLNFAFYKIPWLISLRFVGNIGNEELAAAALASTICNVTGMSFAVGLNTALTTLSGQARGKLIRLRKRIPENITMEEHRSLLASSPLAYLFRGIAVELLLIVPVGLSWLYGIGPFLSLMVKDETLVFMTEEYLRVLTPGLWSYSINWTLTAWLQSMEMAEIPCYAAFMGLLTHIPFNMLFVDLLGWGHLGVAAATVMFQLIQPILICSYLCFSSKGRKRIFNECFLYKTCQIPLLVVVKDAVFCLEGFKNYVSLALPGVVVISEWWASEIVIFMSSELSPEPTIAVASMSIYQSINSTCSMFPIGASVGGTTRVSNYLGLGGHKKALRAAIVSILYAAISTSMIISILLLCPRSFFPSFFTSDESIIEETAGLIPLLALFVFGDGMKTAFNGVMKACGRQCITMPIVIFSYWIVGIPLAYHYTFKLNGGEMYDCSFLCGVKGLVAAMSVGVWTHLTFLSSIVLFWLDWEAEATLAKQRMQSQESKFELESLASSDLSIRQVSYTSSYSMKHELV